MCAFIQPLQGRSFSTHVWEKPLTCLFPPELSVSYVSNENVFPREDGDEEEDANDEFDASSSRYSQVPILFVAPTVEQVLQCTYVSKQEVLQHTVF